MPEFRKNNPTDGYQPASQQKERHAERGYLMTNENNACSWNKDAADETGRPESQNGAANCPSRNMGFGCGVNWLVNFAHGS